MRRLVNSSSWLSGGVRSRPASILPPVSSTSSFYACHARFSSSSVPPPSEEENALHHEEDVGFTDEAEIYAQGKTVQTAVGPLPTSPLLDRSWQKARERGPAKVKPDPKRFNRFQRRLYRNSYAKMLAEPVRMCQVTRVRLPRSFLQSFGLAQKKKSDEKWWIPDEFNSKGQVKRKLLEQPKEDDGDVAGRMRRNKGYLDAMTKVAATRPSSDKDILDYTLDLAETEHPKDEDAYKDVVPTPNSTRDSFRAPVYVLARQDLLASFLDTKSKYSAGYMRFAGHPGIGSLANGAVWRRDMHLAIPEKLRWKVAAHLAHLGELKGLLKPILGLREDGTARSFLEVVASQELRHEVHNSDAGALLDLGRSDVSEVRGEGATSSRSPPSYPWFTSGMFKRPTTSGEAEESLPKNGLPVFHLPCLLGTEVIETLESKAPDLFQANRWLLLRGSRCNELVAKMWRLQGYIADYKEVTTSGKQEEEQA